MRQEAHSPAANLSAMDRGTASDFERAVRALSRAQHLLVLTGAGISAESGVPTFRGADGLWRSYRAEDLATPEAFRRDPTLVWEWYRARQQTVLGCQPNAGHHALVELASRYPRAALVTQNVDGLHQRAGSLGAIELHGNLFKARCTREQTVQHLIAGEELPPRCTCGALLRPHIVWFGESLPHAAWSEACEHARCCDACLVVGSSSLVSPAASLPLEAARRGVPVIEINLEPTPLTPSTFAALFEAAGSVLPRIVEALQPSSPAESHVDSPST